MATFTTEFIFGQVFIAALRADVRKLRTALTAEFSSIRIYCLTIRALHSHSGYESGALITGRDIVDDYEVFVNVCS